MALDHAPIILAPKPFDPLSFSSSQRSRLDSHKRVFSPCEPFPQSTHPKRLKVSPDPGRGSNSPFNALVPGANSDEGPARKPSTEEWIEEIGHEVPLSVDSQLVHRKTADVSLKPTTKQFPDEPPFFLNHVTPPSADEVNVVSAEDIHQARPDDQGYMSPSGILGDESIDAYRSIIDDLTIENRQLRQRLDNFERSHCSQLQHEKLFEIKVYGLPVHKRLELERTLREFVANLDGSIVKDTTTDDRNRFLVPSSQFGNPSNPNPTPVDSAYASTSASEHTLNFRSKLAGKQRDIRPSSIRNDQQQSLHMQNVPDCPSPSRSRRVSESTKKRSVVERLEQLFTGKSAAIVQPDFPRQQQEVSQSAAIGDRRVAEANGHRSLPEGAREARILPVGMETSLGTTVDQLPNTRDQRISNGLPLGTPSKEEDSPHQRPTRPIDLDIHQAQDGVNNMKYIRHLGLGLSASDPGVSGADEGWVYLNLLISMAQLHTLNVTPDFVRKAVLDMSSKLEMSPDGRKVRWRGGADRVVTSSDYGEPSPDTMDNVRSTSSSASLEKSFTSSTTTHTHDTNSARRSSAVRVPQKALTSSVDPREHSFRQSEQRLCVAVPSVIVGNRSSPVDALSAHDISHVSQEAKEMGPIIYYSNANYCTDLSGNASHAHCDQHDYKRPSQTPLGSFRKHAAVDEFERSFEKRGPISRQMESDLESGSNGSLECSLEFPNLDSLSLNSSPGQTTPLPFEASGLSGIQPEDNFMVDVRVQHNLGHMKDKSSELNLGLELPDILSKSRFGADRLKQPNSNPTVVSSNKIDLEPSSLPSPSYICFPFSLSESELSDSDDDMEDNEFSDVSPQVTWRGTKDLLDTGCLYTSVARQKAGSVVPRSQSLNSRITDKSADSSIDTLSHSRSHNP